MIQTTNFPLSTYTLQACGGWEAVKEEVKELDLDGLEFIADPDNLPDDIPLSLVSGYHMTFYVDWLDFWRQDKAALMRKFSSWETVNEVYRGTKPEDLMRHFQEDLALAQRLKAPYLVFHVSDVSLEEGYTYRWLHTDQEVLDGAIEFINLLLKDADPQLFCRHVKIRWTDSWMMKRWIFPRLYQRRRRSPYITMRSSDSPRH